MSAGFCICPDNADPIAGRLIEAVRDDVYSLNPALKRLLRGRKQYRLSEADLRRLCQLHEWLEEAAGDVQQVIEAQQQRAGDG